MVLFYHSFIVSIKRGIGHGAQGSRNSNRAGSWNHSRGRDGDRLQEEGCIVLRRDEHRRKNDFFVKKKSFIFNVFGHNKDFKLDKYLHRKDNGKPDWRYNEVRAARDVIANMLKNGDLKI